MASRPPRCVPTRGNQETPFVSLGTGHQAAGGFLFEGLEKGVFGSVVGLDLLIVVGMLAEPVVRHLTGNWGWLPLVATADDLDASTLEPVEEGFQNRAGYRAYLVPDNHPGDEFLPHHFGRLFCLAPPAEEVVIGLTWTPRPHFARRWVWVKTRGFLWRKSSIARVVLP